MGFLDAFRKDEIVGTKVLVCDLDAKHADLLKNDERIYRRFYPSTTSLSATVLADFRQALANGCDVAHVFCDVSADGSVADVPQARTAGADLLKLCVNAGVKLLWIASDNFPEPYDAGFNAKGLKLNVVLTERRLGPNFSLFLDNLLTKMSAGEPFSKAWNVASRPEGKSVQPDVPHTTATLGRGGVVLRP